MVVFRWEGKAESNGSRQEHASRGLALRNAYCLLADVAFSDALSGLLRSPSA